MLPFHHVFPVSPQINLSIPFSKPSFHLPGAEQQGDGVHPRKLARTLNGCHIQGTSSLLESPALAFQDNVRG
jgi:hypothetical protein